jgi:hypothetical protein
VSISASISLSREAIWVEAGNGVICSGVGFCACAFASRVAFLAGFVDGGAAGVTGGAAAAVGGAAALTGAFAVPLDPAERKALVTPRTPTMDTTTKPPMSAPPKSVAPLRAARECTALGRTVRTTGGTLLNCAAEGALERAMRSAADAF